MASKPRSIAVALGLIVLVVTAAWLGAADAAGAQLTASWVDNSNGTAATRLERRLAAIATFTAIADLAPGVTQYVDASVSAGTQYCYRAFAFESATASAYSEEACASPAPPAALTLAFTNPASNATVNGTATVSLSASGGSGYTFVVKADGVTIYAGTNASFTWNTTAVTNGTHTLTATVTDAQNNSGTASRTVAVSNPYATTVALSFTSPASGATVHGATTVGLSTTADPGLTKTFTLSVDGTVLTSQTVSLGTTLSYTWDTTRVANGNRTLIATLSVNGGETSKVSLPVVVNNDTTPPPPPTPLGVAFTTPTIGAVVSGVTTIGVAASGAVGSSTFNLAVDGAVVSTLTVTGATATYAWNTSTVRQGTRILSVTVTDGSARAATAVLAVTVGETTRCSAPTARDGECPRDGCDESTGQHCGHRRELPSDRLAWYELDLTVADAASF